MIPRVLPQYPSTAVRVRTLAVTVLVTITLYYALYVKGSVAPLIIADFDMTLTFYVSISIAGSLVGAFAALAASRTDRVGRTGIVLGGTAVVTLLTLVVIPTAGSKTVFLIADVTQAGVLGAILVATTALVRDFAPQLNRATGMCVWNLGPILGSLMVSQVASRTLEDHPDWPYQYRICGLVVLGALVLAWVGLRELSPELRAQVVRGTESPDDVDAAAGAAVLTPLAPGAWRLLLTPTLLLPLVGIGLFLVFYFTRLAYWTIFFTTSFLLTPAPFSLADANALSNWWWGTSALTLLLIGVVSDRLGVRKPLLLGGGLISIVALTLFGSRATEATSYDGFIAVIIPAAFGGVIASSMWLTAYSEAVEAVEPRLVATGMAIYGWVVRISAALSLSAVLVLVPAASTLVDHVAEVGRIYATYPAADRLTDPDPAVRQAAEATMPPEDVAYLAAHRDDVRDGLLEGQDEWGTWWRVCLGAQVVALPLMLLLPGAWRRRRQAEPEAPREEALAAG